MQRLDESTDDTTMFQAIEASARQLGFEHCAYGLRVTMPVTRPQLILLNNHPPAWQKRFAEADYVSIDPTVRHGCASQQPLLWSDEVFRAVPEFWSEANAAGLRHGWSQSSLDGFGIGSMLSLSRSAEPITAAELDLVQPRMRWLVSIAHVSLSRMLVPRVQARDPHLLTARETEVLKWSADGKTSSQISDILIISVDTVNFHVKNAVIKLNTANKTAAVARALMLGLLG